MSLHPDIAAVLAGESEGCIVKGDCLAPGFLADMPDGCVGAVVTDWPYNEVNRADSGLRRFDKGAADSLVVDVGRTTGELARIAKGSVYAWCGTEQVSKCRGVLVGAGMSTRLGFWEKSNPPVANGQHLWLSSIECCVYGKHAGATFNRHCQSPVWRGPIERKAVHPTQKPLWLIEEQVDASSNQCDLILDPFCGSGTTCVAAKKLGRRFIGIEIDETYCKIAQRRVASTPRPLFTEPVEKKPEPMLFGGDQ